MLVVGATAVGPTGRGDRNMQLICDNGHVMEGATPSARFCRTCGAGLRRTCPHGHPAGLDARFCRTCGVPLAPERAPEDEEGPDDSAGTEEETGASGTQQPAPGRPFFNWLTGDATDVPNPPVAEAPISEEPEVKAPSASPLPVQPDTAAPTGEERVIDGVGTTPPETVTQRLVARTTAGATLAPAVHTPPPVYARRPSRRWVAPMAIAAAVLIAGAAVGAALVVIHHDNQGSSNHSTAAQATRKSAATLPTAGMQTTATAAPPPAPSTSTTNPIAAEEAATLANLLSQSANQRSGVVAAVAAISSCGDLSGAQEALSIAATQRNRLLQQLENDQFAALPNSSQLILALSTAWESSESSDNSYAQWAQDEMDRYTGFGTFTSTYTYTSTAVVTSTGSGCVPDDYADANYQAAQQTDQQASTAKQAFVNEWNPVATTYGLPTWTSNQV